MTLDGDHRPLLLDATGAERSRALCIGAAPSRRLPSRTSTVEIHVPCALSITDPNGSATNTAHARGLRRSKSPGGLAEPGFVQQTS